MFIGFASKGECYWTQAASEAEQTPLWKIQEYLERYSEFCHMILQY